MFVNLGFGQRDFFSLGWFKNILALLLRGWFRVF